MLSTPACRVGPASPISVSLLRHQKLMLVLARKMPAWGQTRGSLMQDLWTEGLRTPGKMTLGNMTRAFATQEHPTRACHWVARVLWTPHALVESAARAFVATYAAMVPMLPANRARLAPVHRAALGPRAFQPAPVFWAVTERFPLVPQRAQRERVPWACAVRRVPVSKR
jgi:hypothetical protein